MPIKKALINDELVIPAKAGIHENSRYWTPAFAGVTIKSELH
jgi:hypothetical protein